MSTPFTLFAVQIATAGFIKGIVSENYDPKLAKIIQAADSEVYNRHAGMIEADPMIGFESVDVGAAITALGLFGADVPSGQSAIFTFNKLDTGAVRDTAGARTLTAGAGRFYPTGITANQGGRASMNIDFEGINAAGTTHPFTFGTGAPSITLGFGTLFTVGRVKVGSTFLNDIQSIRIDTGLGRQFNRGDGRPYRNFAGLNAIAPTITFATTDATARDAISDEGSNAIITVWLRALTNKGVPAADAATTHLKFVVNSGYTHPTPASAQQGGIAGFEFMTECIFDGTNAPIVSSTGAIA